MPSGICDVAIEVDGEDVGRALLAAGLARVTKEYINEDEKMGKMVEDYREVETHARASHTGMFRYGDPGDSDDERGFKSV